MNKTLSLFLVLLCLGATPLPPLPPIPKVKKQLAKLAGPGPLVPTTVKVQWQTNNADFYLLQSTRDLLNWTNVAYFTNVYSASFPLKGKTNLFFKAFGYSDSQSNFTVNVAWNYYDLGISSFKVYYGQSPLVYSITNLVPYSSSMGTNQTASITNLPGNSTFYFAVTGIDSYGNESPFSNQIWTNFPSGKYFVPNKIPLSVSLR